MFFSLTFSTTSAGALLRKFLLLSLFETAESSFASLLISFSRRPASFAKSIMPSSDTKIEAPFTIAVADDFGFIPDSLTENDLSLARLIMMS